MDEIEKVARALCIDSGANPDTLVETSEMEVIRESANSMRTQPVRSARWKEFEKEARRFVAAYNAMTKS